jgi:hypothetical protein
LVVNENYTPDTEEIPLDFSVEWLHGRRDADDVLDQNETIQLAESMNPA